jgi:hypothetical protein
VPSQRSQDAAGDASDGHLLALGALHVFAKPVLSFAALARTLKAVIAA